MKDKELRKLIGSRAKQRRLELNLTQPYVCLLYTSIRQTGIEISCIPRNLIIVIFYYQISLKPLKTLNLSQVSFPL